MRLSNLPGLRPIPLIAPRRWFWFTSGPDVRSEADLEPRNSFGASPMWSSFVWQVATRMRREPCWCLKWPRKLFSRMESRKLPGWRRLMVLLDLGLFPVLLVVIMVGSPKDCEVSSECFLPAS